MRFVKKLSYLVVCDSVEIIKAVSASVALLSMLVVFPSSELGVTVETESEAEIDMAFIS